MRSWHASHPGVNFQLINDWVKNGNSDRSCTTLIATVAIRLTRGQLANHNKISVSYYEVAQNCSLRYSRFLNILLLRTKISETIKARGLFGYCHLQFRNPAHVRIKRHLEAVCFLAGAITTFFVQSQQATHQCSSPSSPCQTKYIS